MAWKPVTVTVALLVTGAVLLVDTGAVPAAFPATIAAAHPMPTAAEVQMIPVEGEAERHWSRWRGPSGQGLVSGSGYVDTWSDTDNVLWKVAVPGRGNSSPIVWGNQIFLTTATDGGARVALLAFDRNDGRQLWEAAPARTSAERVHQKNGHASGTAATDGERVYAYLGNHGLIATDMQGEIVWHRDFGQIHASHGTAGSVLLYGDRVIFYQDMQRGAQVGSFIAALDARTGETVWWTDRKEDTGWGTPIAIRVDGHDEIVVSSQYMVYGYSASTGEELWNAGGNMFEVIPTPVVGHGLVFSSSGRAGPTLAIRPGGRGDVTDTHVAWSSPKGSPFVPSTLVYGENLYMINDMASVLTVYRAASGEVLYQGRLGRAQRESFSASPVVFDGKVFLTNDGGETFVIAAGDEFKLLQANDIGERTLASPALVDGRWYVRTEGHLLALGGD
jgi:outer membrane protein assembly factor BamB